MTDDNNRGAEAIAEAMWKLVTDVVGRRLEVEDPQRSWSWLLKNDPYIAAELRLRAHRAMDSGGLVQASAGASNESSAMDMRLKEALLRRA